MRNLMVTLILLNLTGVADAACRCVCIEGYSTPQPLCDSSIEVRPICAPRVCPVAQPSVPPVQAPVVPPVGTTNCQQEHVFNPFTGQYEWKTVCR